MSRPREFDEACVLDAAMQCFWSRGYEATSMRTLADCMGISAASLYNAFGDKRALYRRALGHYATRNARARIARLEASTSPREAIARFFAEVMQRALADRERRGCMLINAALDMAALDPKLRDLVAAELREIEAFFLRMVEAGQRDGSISRSPPAPDFARHLLGVFVGVRVLARTRPERDLLEGAMRPALSLLEQQSQGKAKQCHDRPLLLADAERPGFGCRAVTDEGNKLLFGQTAASVARAS